MIGGILNVNKPDGITSHDVVKIVRGITGIKKVGHAGTLDPEATGVLIVCIGYATKFANKFTMEKKLYAGVMRLGIRTDTQDAQGKVIKTVENFNYQLDEIQKVFSKFVGEIDQIPPMYSAVKHKGVPLYRLARKGITVERAPKRINIYRLDIKKYSDGKFIEFEAETSAGTYIRTLCDDIGEILGCGGHLSKLVRLKVGQNSIEESYSIDDLRNANTNGTLDRLIMPVSG